MKHAPLPLPLLGLCCCLALLLFPSSGLASERIKVLTSTFPLYQLTRNITQGSDRIEVDLMIPAQLGCPHDYTLVPRDMEKLARADILIINGLGMEEFLGAPVRKANPAIKVLDSSQGIDQILSYATAPKEEHAHASHQDGEHGEHHHGSNRNPHLFASPRMAALLTANIARMLAEVDPDGTPTYTANARTYGQRLNQLADTFVELGRRLRNNRIVTQHGVFDYLARDMGLEVVAVVQAHAGQQPSAAEMLDIVATVKRKKAGAIFTEPQYPEAVGTTIAREASIPAATLDPGATGPEQAPLDYYEQVMRLNLETMENILGVH